MELETERLKLRQWREQDLPPFARMNADAEVMAYFPATLSEAQSNTFAERMAGLIATRGWGLWAAEEKSSGAFMGYLGLHEINDALPFAPGIEIGWRLALQFWGQGYACEGARAVLRYAFTSLQLPQVVSFTAVSNQRSRALMDRLHMINTHENFQHPAVPAESRLREHVLYKLTRQRWLEFAQREA